MVSTGVAISAIVLKSGEVFRFWQNLKIATPIRFSYPSVFCYPIIPFSAFYIRIRLQLVPVTLCDNQSYEVGILEH